MIVVFASFFGALMLGNFISFFLFSLHEYGFYPLHFLTSFVVIFLATHPYDIVPLRQDLTRIAIASTALTGYWLAIHLLAATFLGGARVN